MVEIEHVTEEKLKKILDLDKERKHCYYRRFNEKTWEAVAHGECKSEDCLHTKLSMPVSEILKRYDIRLEDTLELIDMELMKKMNDEGKFDDCGVKNFLNTEERMRHYIDFWCNYASIDSPNCSLPFKEDYISKVNDWASKNVFERIKNSGEVYRGVSAEYIKDVDALIAEITKNGIRPYHVNGAPLIGLSASKRVAEEWVRGGIFLVIDAKGLDLRPVRYGTLYQSNYSEPIKECDSHDELLPNRAEAEVRTPYIPAENIKKIYILKEADKNGS